MNDKTSATILRELEQVRKTGGGILSPAAVVEFARNPKTALHREFDWSDTDAAKKWRLHQARNLIRVVVTVLPETGENVRVFASLTRDRNPEGGYRAMVDVLRDKDLRALLLADALRDMKVFQEKYRQLSELAEVFAAMRSAGNRVRARKAARRPRNAKLTRKAS